MNRSGQLRDLQILAILVPALCAGIYETLRHSVLPGDLPFDLGTPVAVVLVLAISSGFAHVSSVLRMMPKEQRQPRQLR